MFVRTIELFSGSESFSSVACQRGHKTFTVDVRGEYAPDLVADVRLLSAGDFPYTPDFLWASPPCQGFSVAAIGKNWRHPSRGEYTPITKSANEAIELVEHTLRLIYHEIRPTWFFIENPRAMLRKLPHLKHLIRHTVTYCQYGDTRMKPTDIWTNADWWWPRQPCKNGDSCHVPAPRGSRTGTQGPSSTYEKGKIPAELFHEIFSQFIKFALDKPNETMV